MALFCLLTSPLAWSIVLCSLNTCCFYVCNYTFFFDFATARTECAVSRHVHCAFKRFVHNLTALWANLRISIHPGNDTNRYPPLIKPCKILQHVLCCANRWEKDLKTRQLSYVRWESVLLVQLEPWWMWFQYLHCRTVRGQCVQWENIYVKAEGEQLDWRSCTSTCSYWMRAFRPRSEHEAHQSVAAKFMNFCHCVHAQWHGGKNNSS